jgi:hypothetical protein
MNDIDEPITYARVIVEIQRHGITEGEFLDFFNVQDFYDSSEVLSWLGY